MTTNAAHHARVLQGSVGAGGGAANRRHDVQLVQHLLNQVAPQGSGALPEDGVCTTGLIHRIRRFQAVTLQFRAPDGRVDPGGRTLRGLLSHAALRRVPPAAAARPAADAAVAGRARSAIRAAQADSHQSRQAETGLTSATKSGGGLTDQDYARAAARLGPGISPALVRAYAEVESGGKAGFGPAGLPVIAFEGHIFRKYTKKIYDQSHPLLSYRYVKKAGPEWRKNNADQATAWQTLREAAALDHDAALNACSWGMFQVMGFNSKACGYPNVTAFVEAMKAGEAGQLEAFIGYCKSRSGLVQAMANKNYVMMARLYNGDDYGDYDRRIERAYKKHGGQ